MDTKALRTFLSEDSIKLHMSYMNELKLKCSVIKKSVPELNGKTLRQVIKMPNRDGVKEEILPLINSVKSHELYFYSFAEQPSSCKRIRDYYSSESAFLYELYTHARGKLWGFLYIAPRKDRPPEIAFGDGISLPPLGSSPLLAIDLYEHSYLPDYSLDRDKYLRAMLTHLDINRLFSSENAEIYLDTLI